MKNIFIKASTIFLSLFLAANVYGQEKFIEKNLPQTELKQGAKSKTNNGNLSQIKDSIDKTILQKRITSLMFDDEEYSNIKLAIETFKNEPLDPELRAKKLATEAGGKKDLAKNENGDEKFNIYLNSILYFNPQNWVIWVNNQKITSRKNKKEEEIFVKQVTKEKVKLIWQMSLSKWKILSKSPEDSDAPLLNGDNKVEVEIELKQNQTYVLSSKKVFEGKVHAKDTKVEDKNISVEKIKKISTNTVN